jgi:hypothetical protein
LFHRSFVAVFCSYITILLPSLLFTEFTTSWYYVLVLQSTVPCTVHGILLFWRYVGLYLILFSFILFCLWNYWSTVAICLH